MIYFFNFANKTISGEDVNGEYEGMVYSYAAEEYHMQNQVLVYNGGEFARFTQSFPNGVLKSNISNTDGLLSCFPSFNTKTTAEFAGFLHMNGDMCGKDFSIANFSMGSDMLHSGQKAGPLVAFDEYGNAMVISAFSNFMAHSMMYDSVTSQLYYGILGGFKSVPQHYQIDTILYFGDEGMNRAIEGWGEVLARRYGKSRSRRDSDLTVKYLGYYTDNGAYYYYNTEPKMNYEETILGVVNQSKFEGIPYKYVQYDSWFYYKGLGDGVKEWVAMPSIFPNGTVGLFQEHGMPVAAHNRYWASDNVYATQNGGKYSFYIDTLSGKALPDDYRFWSDFFHNATKWGLILYEQDWLDIEFENMDTIHEDINVGKYWLKSMGQAAEEHGISIQYCMALSRHMLQSIEIPAVTQARVSDDYHPGNSQWKTGVESMFANALHLAPFKDTFWSTSNQTGSPYGNDTEPNTDLQAAMATLTTGPVGPGDRYSNMSKNILKTCRADGMILKPSRPITVWDQHVINHAFPKNMKAGSPNLDAEVYSTYTDIPFTNGPLRHGIMVVTDLNVTDFKATPSIMFLDETKYTDYIAYHGHPGNDGNIHKFSDNSPLTIPKCGRSDFQLWYFAPVIEVSSQSHVAILGQRNKWVPVSTQRIKNVEHKENDLLVDIEGMPGEAVQFGFSVNQFVEFVNCNIPSTGKARINLNTLTCSAI
ncbi:uncharacterized protein LOC120331113 [Styela clava]